MPRRHDDLHDNDAKTRRKQEDVRRMRFRRAIEDYVDGLRLQRALSDYPELLARPLPARHLRPARKSAPPAG